MPASLDEAIPRGEDYKTVPVNAADLVARQRLFFDSGATRPASFRIEQLRSFEAAIRRSEAALLDALHADLRKPPHEAYTSEIGFVLADLHHAIHHLRSWMRPQRRGLARIAWPGSASVVPAPLGIALIIGPWNYPFQLVASPLVGALAAGNCACLKPSEFAPHTSRALAGLIAGAFPPDLVAVVEGGRDAAEALLGQKFDHVFFTGSAAVGGAVMAAAARHLTPVTLELGGKCPAIVCADAAIDVAARRIAWGKFLNAGQTCVAPDFVLAERPVVEPLVAALKRAISTFFGGDPRRSPDYARIVNRRHFQRLVPYLSVGRIAAGGEHDEADLYIAPTVLTDTAPDTAVMRDEIFGPILPVVAFDDLNAVLAGLRKRPPPLAVYLFTSDRAIGRRVVADTRSGGICINDTIVQIAGQSLPFGGVGESGMGRYHGKASFDCFSHLRTVVTRPTAFDPGLRYPPPRLPLDRLKAVYRFLLRG